MSTFNFNDNAWYQIQNAQLPGQSLYANYKYEADQTTKVFPEPTDNTHTGQQFQFFGTSLSANTFLVRANRPGSSLYLSTANEKKDGTSTPVMKHSNFLTSDASALWNVTAWNDGTFYMTNWANGTLYHLAAGSDGTLFMDKDTSNSNSHRWSFNKVGGNIDCPSWSYAQTPTAAPAAATQTGGDAHLPTATNNAKVVDNGNANANDANTTTTSQPQADSSLSPGSIAGIAVGATAIVAIISLLAIYFMLRQREKKQQPPAKSDWPYNPMAQDSQQSLVPNGHSHAHAHSHTHYHPVVRSYSAGNYNYGDRKVDLMAKDSPTLPTYSAVDNSIYQVAQPHQPGGPTSVHPAHRQGWTRVGELEGSTRAPELDATTKPHTYSKPDLFLANSQGSSTQPQKRHRRQSSTSRLERVAFGMSTPRFSRYR